MTRRGTTPTHIFRPKNKKKEAIDLRSAAVIFMTYKQAGKVVFEKTKDDMEITETEVRIHLSQEDTLKLSTLSEVKIQCRARYPDGEAIGSKVKTVPVCEILKDGVI